ncbi:hypothetical protein L1049_018823 [Liquidambar formosana]|uniref:Uncharacterized protein n=1 Tax=Liquidambar formosana TaxID=63359 RepID=A0AAP0RAM2_LIQFO
MAQQISVPKSSVPILFPSKEDALIKVDMINLCPGQGGWDWGWVFDPRPGCMILHFTIHFLRKSYGSMRKRIMEGSSSLNPSAKKESELEMLQKQHEEKLLKIQELKRQIESAKLRLEKKKKKVPEEKMEAFKALSEKYNSLRDEYNTLLAEKYGQNVE